MKKLEKEYENNLYHRHNKILSPSFFEIVSMMVSAPLNIQGEVPQT